MRRHLSSASEQEKARTGEGVIAKVELKRRLTFVCAKEDGKASFEQETEGAS